jgi:hypothetical protein
MEGISADAKEQLLEEAVHRERIVQVFPRGSAHTGACDQDRAFEQEMSAALNAAHGTKRCVNTEAVELPRELRRRVD